MITKINLNNSKTVQKLFELQKEAYLVEAKLVNYFDLPPLKESFCKFLRSRETFLGYFAGEELAGAISYMLEGTVLTVCRMVVHSGHFRQGIAQKLLSHVEDISQECTIIRVTTGKDNLPAINLYKKIGYVFINNIEAAPGFYISSFEKKLFK